MSAEEFQELAQTIVDKVGRHYARLVHDEIRDYQLVSTPELREVENVITQYPPLLPRGAKRMLNNARLLTQIARDRQLFGGRPPLTPAHLGEWIVLAARWPTIAAQIAAEPALMAELESIDDLNALRQILDARGTIVSEGQHHLLQLLREEPRLSDVVTRLVHFEPASDGPGASTVVRVPDGLP